MEDSTREDSARESSAMDDASSPRQFDRLADESSLDADRLALITKVRALLEQLLETRAILGERSVSVEALQNYSLGSIIVLPDVDPRRLRLEVAGLTVAHGETVRVGGRLGLRITEVLPPREVLERWSRRIPTEPRPEPQSEA
ncbi:MAG: FliM/FliN family flagellar motor C-terminal domain-containing protein [Planctomycetota bacterium]